MADAETESGGVECLLCMERYTKADIEAGLYWIETLVCSKCYAKMQQSSHPVSCFGKPTFILENGKRLYGYNGCVEPCKSVCPDRKICRRIVDVSE